MNFDSTQLKQNKGGRNIKQADRSSVFSFTLLDANGREIDLDGKLAKVALFNFNSRREWETTATVRGADIEFKLPGNLHEDDYILEISCDGYIFPSSNDLIISVNKGFAELIDGDTAETIGKTAEEIISEAALKAIEKIPYERLKGEKGDTGPKGERGERGPAGKDGTINVAEMTESQLMTIKRQLDIPTSDDFVSPEKYNEDISDLKTNKVDKSSLDNYYTSTEIEESFTNYAQVVDELTTKLTELDDSKADKTSLNQYLLKTEVPRLPDDVVKRGELTSLKTSIDKNLDSIDNLKVQVTNNVDMIESYSQRITSFEESFNTKLDRKVDKVGGKGLSTNDFNNIYKAKIDNIPSNPQYTDTKYIANKGIKQIGNSFALQNVAQDTALAIWSGSKYDYNRLTKKDNNTIYFVVE